MSSLAGWFSNYKPKIVNERNLANEGPNCSMLFIKIFGSPLGKVKNCHPRTTPQVS